MKYSFTLRILYIKLFVMLNKSLKKVLSNFFSVNAYLICVVFCPFLNPDGY